MFLVVFRKSTLYVVFCVPLGLSPGILWGGPGAQRPDQGHGHSEASFRSCFAIRAGSRGSPRPRITTYRCAESLRRDRCVFKTLVKYEGLEPFWHPRGPKHKENACLCVLFVPRRLPKRPPEGEERKTFVNSDRIWGVCLLSFSCPLRFLSRGSGFLCGAVLAAPSVPQGCLGDPFWVLLRAARGAQKGPPYRRDSLLLGSLWRPLGCPVGSRTLSSLSFGPFP